MVEKRQTRNTEGESPLKNFRIELDMSQEEFARAIGTTARTISRWEAGDTEPTFTVSQIKAFERLLASRGKTIQDLPDSFRPQKKSPE
ncbi:MAG: helix-turn-helix transcriptional regulator [Scytonema sp. PMC 1069.18]|nr:helix-turn-helix transcriptional regulator [Scytonema sp. PMC 1069.18]MEC4886869.1 helix-turn-helix transcriptional regulator [Scytonema sp. PMC 1070.18]